MNQNSFHDESLTRDPPVIGYGHGVNIIYGNESFFPLEGFSGAQKAKVSSIS